MNATLAQLGYVWARVGGSEVAHLIPPVIKRASRSVCGRVALADTQMQVPTLARTCLACAAYGGPSA